MELTEELRNTRAHRSLYGGLILLPLLDNFERYPFSCAAPLNKSRAALRQPLE
jgi:hypothetical protein